MGSVALFHVVAAQIEQATQAPVWGAWAVRRLALLVTGILAAKTTVLAQVAAELQVLGITHATLPESVERGLRRTLAAGRLDAQGYTHTLATAVDWESLRQTGQPVVLALDESSQDDRIHVLRLSLTCWGGAVPVAWALWEQNVAVPAGFYWQQVEQVLATAAQALPSDLAVVVTADRAFDVAPFVDRATVQGWHWLVRAKARGDLRFRDQRGRERPVREVVLQHVPRVGCRWKARGWLFKKAGWRAASVVAVWAPGHAEPLVVISDLPPRWDLLRLYDRRFWIEAGFRNDKTAGWQWEASGVSGVAHQRVLVLAMAWATLLTVVLGIQDATQRLHRLRRRPLRPRPPGWWGCVVERARVSVFTLGLRRLSAWRTALAPALLRWLLPDLAGPSWNDRWRHAQIARNLAAIPVRP
jgi:hypothetical protein